MESEARRIDSRSSSRRSGWTISRPRRDMRNAHGIDDPSTGRRVQYMTRTMKWILPAVLLLGAAPALAGGLDRLGTAGAQELRVPVGAASVALGGSSVAMGGGLSNVFYNPASLAATDESEAMATWSSYLADADVNYIAFSTKLGT